MYVSDWVSVSIDFIDVTLVSDYTSGDEEDEEDEEGEEEKEDEEDEIVKEVK